MIGVDTNVLIRLYVADNPEQHDAAVAFFAKRSEASRAYVSLIVLVEFVWSLTRTYKYGWDRVLALVGALTATRDVLIEREEVVVEALAHAEDDHAGLVDTIIAMANRADGCDTTMTFDRAAAKRLPSMELLA